MFLNSLLSRKIWSWGFHQNTEVPILWSGVVFLDMYREESLCWLFGFARLLLSLCCSFLLPGIQLLPHKMEFDNFKIPPRVYFILQPSNDRKKTQGDARGKVNSRSPAGIIEILENNSIHFSTVCILLTGFEKSKLRDPAMHNLLL